jgi:hypothetical protein
LVLTNDSEWFAFSTHEAGWEQINNLRSGCFIKQFVLHFTKLQLTCVDWWLLHLVLAWNWVFSIRATNINFHKSSLVFDKGLKRGPFRETLFFLFFPSVVLAL